MLLSGLVEERHIHGLRGRIFRSELERVSKFYSAPNFQTGLTAGRTNVPFAHLGDVDLSLDIFSLDIFSLKSKSRPGSTFL